MSQFEIACVESVIENEMAQGCTQKQIAQTYALGLRSSWPTDWKRVNAAILKRWPHGLERIKKMARDGSCFPEQPSDAEPRSSGLVSDTDFDLFDSCACCGKNPGLCGCSLVGWCEVCGKCCECCPRVDECDMLIAGDGI